jgi:hypothetical protein
MGIDVRGALRNFKASEWKQCAKDPETGRYLTPAEVKECLMDELAKGHVVIPMGEACEGFDYGGGGCPGHPIQED